MIMLSLSVTDMNDIMINMTVFVKLHWCFSVSRMADARGPGTSVPTAERGV